MRPSRYCEREQKLRLQKAVLPRMVIADAISRNMPVVVGVSALDIEAFQTFSELKAIKR